MMKRAVFLSACLIFSCLVFGTPDNTRIKPQKPLGKPGDTSGGGGMSCPEGKTLKTYGGKLRAFGNDRHCQKRSQYYSCWISVCEDQN